MRLPDQLHRRLIVTLAAQQRFQGCSGPLVPSNSPVWLRNVRNQTNIAIVHILRGRISIRDRAKLERKSNGTYAPH